MFVHSCASTWKPTHAMEVKKDNCITSTPFNANESQGIVHAHVFNSFANEKCGFSFFHLWRKLAQ